MKKIITSEPDTLTEYLIKIWQYRSLIVVFAKRDLRVKYAQTWLGLGWTIVQPLMAVAVFTLFFSLLINFKSHYPYVLFVLTGIMIWGLFNYIFSQASNSLLNNQDIISKMSFPKIILPLSKIIVALVEFAVTIALFFVALIFLYPFVKWQIIFSLFIVINVIIFSLGLSLILSAATIKYRDLNHVVPFLVNFGIWFTPVFYPVSLIPDKWAHLIYLNPMASFVQLFRCTVLPEKFQTEMLLGIPIGLVIFTIGFFYFKSIEDSIVDSI